MSVTRSPLGGSEDQMTSRDLVVADFNGDGLADLAVANLADRSVEVFLSNQGTLVSHATFPLRVNPRFLRAVDVDGDGKKEIVAALFAKGVW